MKFGYREHGHLTVRSQYRDLPWSGRQLGAESFQPGTVEQIFPDLEQRQLGTTKRN